MRLLPQCIFGLAAVLLGAAMFGPASAGAASLPTVQVAIDVNTSGNGDNALGPTEACNATPLQVGDSLDVDVVIRGVPQYEPGASSEPYGRNGIAGFGFNFLFDPAILQVNGVQAFDGPTILKAAENTIKLVGLDYDGRDPSSREGPAGTTGNVRVDMFGGVPAQPLPSGDGVLTRITLQAVREGTSRLDLTADGAAPFVMLSASGVGYEIANSPASVVVGEVSCANPTPSPFVVPTPVALPPTGGLPGSADSTALPIGEALLGGVMALSAAFVLARRTTRH